MSWLSVVPPWQQKYELYTSFLYKLKIHIFFLSMLIFYFMLLQKLINEKCRKLPKRVAFYTVDCKDSCGEIFVDLQVHRYSKVIPVCNLFYLSCIWYLCHFLDL